MMDRREALLLVQLLKGKDRTSPPYRDHQRDEDHDGEGDGTALFKAPHPVILERGGRRLRRTLLSRYLVQL